MKVGDKVKVKSLEWYNENEDVRGHIDFGGISFNRAMSQFCGQTLTVKNVTKDCFLVEENDWAWTEDMIEHEIKWVYVSDESEEHARGSKAKRIYIQPFRKRHLCVEIADTKEYPDGDYSVVSWKYVVPVETENSELLENITRMEKELAKMKAKLNERSDK